MALSSMTGFARSHGASGPYTFEWELKSVNAKGLDVRVRLPHGHIWTFGEVDAFIDSHLKGGDPLPAVGEMTRDGDTVSAKVTAKSELKEASLHYAVATGPWQKREWKSLPAELKDGRASGRLPADQPLVYYLSVTDRRGLEVSAPHAEVPAGK